MFPKKVLKLILLDIIIVSVHCYHYNDHNYNVISSSILFYVKFDGRLSRNIFHGGQVLCRNQSIDLQCKSFDWLLYGAGFVEGEEGVPKQILVVYIFVNYIFVNIFFIIGSILLSQDYRRVQMVLFYLSMPVDSVLWYARVGIQISNTSI